MLWPWTSWEIDHANCPSCRPFAFSEKGHGRWEQLFILTNDSLEFGGVLREDSCSPWEFCLFAEYEELIAPFSPAADKASMRDVFGATEDDVSRLRIVSLQEVQSVPLFRPCLESSSERIYCLTKSDGWPMQRDDSCLHGNLPFILG